MKRTIFLGCLFLVIIGGCWAASNRVATQGASDLTKSLVTPVDDSEADRTVSGAPELDPPLPTAEGEHRQAFDLMQNRPLGHRITVGPTGRSSWVDASQPDFVRYVQGNHRRDWLLESSVDGVDDFPELVAATRGRSAELTMPAYDDGSAEVLQAAIFNPAQWDNAMTLRVNGDQAAVVTLEEQGWQIVEIDLNDVDIAADNTVGIEFSNLGRIQGSLSGGGLGWMRIGPADESADSGPHRSPEGQGPMHLDAGQGLSWTVWIHDDSLLELEVDAEAGCGPTVDIAVEGGGGEVEAVLTHQAELVAGRGQSQTTAMDIPVEESQVGRIDFFVDDSGECETIEIRRAELIRPGKPTSVPDDFKAPKYVLFWIIDTLRADYLPLHFETDVQAPNLERLADGGVSFANAYVQGTESRASHATLFTGQYPERHRVMATGRVDPQLPILPHFFRDEGYATGIIAANGYVSHLLNLDRGWDFYRNLIHEEVSLNAEYLVEHGLDWIDGVGGDPFFLYLGTIDPHATYWRHDDFIGLYEPEDYSGRFQRQLSGKQLEKIKARAMTPTEREKERIINLYKNEITYNDHAFGEMRKALEEKGIWDDTLVVITADHGEEFWEHGSVGHGHNVHQEMVHVPLIFHYPRELPEGRVVEAGAEVVDVLPTVVEMLGMEALDDRQGMDLLPLIYGEHGGYPSPALATQYMHQYGLQIRHWKLYLRSGSMRLYDRRSDPQEMEDIRGDHPLASRWLQDSIGWFRAHREEWDKSTWGVANNVSDDFVELVGADE